ncbi:MAG TPA: LysR family transcriptional regulator [Sulfurovum sp.]|jgi:DNA-binding transcriptional LysR family regulator|nr:MAG: LysR family transcriptional regulator [Sulfurovum sp. 35-42-20]OYZ25820.1 MAG: LysR family transcriptional regulator [Sulfurovum sp. 16-42-52]OYZ49432.1 MAG: LysR family transcriptional regulator [Sulfurovum sp. 24-42-9]OZA45200.1 MAG: LysR family transcriptional regulator [Sulfurovum sp. 17-42-90]HQS72281.1 LysR family transcriptional regulator [Sulfurovum sp.]
MLKDFVKLETFLTVARERSFSKASAKLGISQPAVTQQIKFIEKYLGAKIIERKKNGIKLTNEGEELYKVATRLEKEIHSAEQDVLKIINKEITFRLGASYTIGTYIIPGQCLNTVGEAIHNSVQLDIDVSDKIVEKLKDRKLDVGLIESPIMDSDLIYREWLEDELVLVSNVPIPKIVKTEDLYTFDWICRNEASHTRKVVAEVFEELGVSCKNFNVLSEVSNTTTVLQTIKKSERNPDRPVVSILSKYAIMDEVANGELFEARLRGYTMTRNFYIVYSKENKHNAYVDQVVNFILAGHC